MSNPTQPQQLDLFDEQEEYDVYYCIYCGHGSEEPGTVCESCYEAKETQGWGTLL